MSGNTHSAAYCLHLLVLVVLFYCQFTNVLLMSQFSVLNVFYSFSKFILHIFKEVAINIRLAFSTCK